MQENNQNGNATPSFNNNVLSSPTTIAGAIHVVLSTGFIAIFQYGFQADKDNPYGFLLITVTPAVSFIITAMIMWRVLRYQISSTQKFQIQMLKSDIAGIQIKYQIINSEIDNNIMALEEKLDRADINSKSDIQQQIDHYQERKRFYDQEKFEEIRKVNTPHAADINLLPKDLNKIN